MNYLHLHGVVSQAPLISRGLGEKNMTRETEVVSREPTSLRGKTLVSATTIGFFQIEAIDIAAMSGKSRRGKPPTHKVRCVGDKYFTILKKLFIGTEVELVGQISSSSYAVHGKRQEMSDILIDEEMGSIQIYKEGRSDAEQ